MHHQAKTCFCGILVGIPQHLKDYLMYVIVTRKIISSYYIVFDENISSIIAYKSQPYLKAMAMHTDVSYTPYATPLKEQTSNRITFEQFKGENL